jgi:roadblock/LC7 domain-containing protein
MIEVKTLTKENSIMRKATLVLLSVTLVALLILSACASPVQSPVQQGQSVPSAVVNGTEGKQYDGVSGLIFSPDGTQVAYVASLGSKQLAVVNGTEGKQYDGVSGLIFSPDGTQVAYVASLGSKQLAVVNGTEGTQYDGVSGLIFSPDGTQVAYVATSGSKQMAVVD